MIERRRKSGKNSNQSTLDLLVNFGDTTPFSIFAVG